jgi:hypothetical protein
MDEKIVKPLFFIRRFLPEWMVLVLIYSSTRQKPSVSTLNP